MSKLVLLILSLVLIILIAGCTQQPTGNNIVASSNEQQTVQQPKTDVGTTITKDDISVKLDDAYIDIDDGKLRMGAQIHAKENAFNRHLEYTNAASFICEIYEPQSGKFFISPQMIFDFGQKEWDYLCAFFSTDSEFDNFLKNIKSPIFIIYSTQIVEVRSLMDKNRDIESIKSLPETYVFEFQPDVSSLPSIGNKPSESNPVIPEEVVNKTVEPIETNKTVALWHFDEGAGGIANDSSGYGNTGWLRGDPTWKSGNDCKFGNCLQFDGSDDCLSVDYSPIFDITEKITLESWIYRESYDNGSIICKNGPYALRIMNNKVEGDVYAGNPIVWSEASGNTPLQLNTWYHVAMTYDGSNIKIYVNGQLDGSLPNNGLMASSGGMFIIGSGEPGCNQPFKGIMDEVIVSNYTKEFFNIT